MAIYTNQNIWLPENVHPCHTMHSLQKGIELVMSLLGWFREWKGNGKRATGHLLSAVFKKPFTSFVYIVTFQNLWFPRIVIWILQGTLSDSIAYWSLKRNFYSLTLLHNYRHTILHNYRHTISTVLLIFIAVVIL